MASGGVGGGEMNPIQTVLAEVVTITLGIAGSFLVPEADREQYWTVVGWALVVLVLVHGVWWLIQRRRAAKSADSVTPTTPSAEGFDWSRLRDAMEKLAEKEIFGIAGITLNATFVSQSYEAEAPVWQGDEAPEDLLALLTDPSLYATLKQAGKPLLVLGDFGTGKSSALKMVAATLARRNREAARAALDAPSDHRPPETTAPTASPALTPLFIPLKALVAENQPHLKQAIQTWLRTEYGPLDLDAPGRELLLILDGFDELDLYHSGAGEDRVKQYFEQLTGLA
ncbi:MAG: hypothetical protein HQL50_09910, partial [Magnetococcales bacterium]|nr:hypothetical protein [Magnetococcales bacterium]